MLMMIIPAVEPSDLSWPADCLVQGRPFHWEGCEGPPGCPDDNNDYEDDNDDEVDDDDKVDDDGGVDDD